MMVLKALGIFVAAVAAGTFFAIAVKVCWAVDDPRREFEAAARRRRHRWRMR